MSAAVKPKSKIIGVGYYVPPTVVTNADLALKHGIDTSDEWIQQRTGIKQRHFVDSGVVNSDLALQASERALFSAGIKKEELDCIIFSTLSPEYDFPGGGCFLQAKLGVPGIAAIDIRNQCSGFLYGLAVADGFIRSGLYKKILVVGSEVHSRGLDLSTRGRDVSVLFGDGAGAAVVAPTENGEDRGIYSVHLHADGSFAKELWLPGPGSAFEPRISNEMIEDGSIYPKMNGKTVFMHAVKRMPESIAEALSHNGMKIEDIDLLVPHQANMRINEAVGKAIGLSSEKVFNTIERFGNTTAATIPIGLSEAVSQGKLKPGMLVALTAFGSGFTWGSALIRW